MSGRPFHLAWFIGNSFGVHGWQDRWGGAGPVNWWDASLQVDLARAAERASLDFVFFEDSVFVPDNYGSKMDFYLKRALRAPKNDPMPLVPLMAQATQHLGLIPTISTSFYPPYLLARLIATLDLMSEGRVGCNFVTSTSMRAAQNFGLDEHIEHDTRYEMADEFVDLVKKLWNSWEPDAVVMDEEGGMFVDPSKVHVVDHQGRFYKSRGPLNTARPAAGPARACAGRRLAAGTRLCGQAYGCRHRRRLQRGGDEVLSRRSARAARRERSRSRQLQADVSGRSGFRRHGRGGARAPQGPPPVAGTRSRRHVQPVRYRLRAIDIDAPLEGLSTNGQQGTFKRFMSKGKTLREIAQNFRFGLEDICGTPESVAGQLAELMEEAGGDGFVIAGPLTRRYIAEVTDGLVPVLQRKGLVRDGYSHAHFRDNLMEF